MAAKPAVSVDVREHAAIDAVTGSRIKVSAAAQGLE